MERLKYTTATKEVSIDSNELYVVILDADKIIARFPKCEFFDWTLEVMAKSRQNTGKPIPDNATKRRKLQAIIALNLADLSAEIVWDRWEGE